MLDTPDPVRPAIRTPPLPEHRRKLQSKTSRPRRKDQHQHPYTPVEELIAIEGHFRLPTVLRQRDAPEDRQHQISAEHQHGRDHTPVEELTLLEGHIRP